MKINISDDEITVYLNNYYIYECDFLSLEFLEKYMNDLFIKIKKMYDIEFNGFYNIDVYLDDNYGAIINIKKENIEYYDYLSDQIDTQVSVHSKTNFLYEIKDYFEIKDYLSNCDYSLYKYNNELYVKFHNHISDKVMTFISEYCNKICFIEDNIVKGSNLIFSTK